MNERVSELSIRKLKNINNKLSELSYFWDSIYQSLIDVRTAYAGMRKEAKDLYYESVDHWVNTARNNTQMASALSEEKISEAALMIKELDFIEQKLCLVDKSYEIRKDADSLRTDKYREEYNEKDAFDCYSTLKRLYKEAVRIASECELTVRSLIVQEIGMLFSDRRRLLYERLYYILSEAKVIQWKLSDCLQLDMAVVRTEWESKRDAEIVQAEKETYEILELANIREKEEIERIIKNSKEQVKGIISIEEVNILRDLANMLEGYELPDKCVEQVDIGKYFVRLNGISGMDEQLEVPAVFDYNEGFSVCFDGDGNERASHEAISSVMFSILKGQPASKQIFYLSDPIHRAKGFDLYLDFYKEFPDVFGGKICTTRDQIKSVVKQLSEFVDEIGQSKLIGYADIFEYNEDVSDKMESLKCLCLLGFPKYFDEEMLEDLENIILNGEQYGIQVLLEFDPQEVNGYRNDSYINCLSRVLSSCLTIKYDQNRWCFESGVEICFKDAPTKHYLHKFISIYAEKYNEMIKTSLPLIKVLPKEAWYKADSIYGLDIPIGKTETGEISYFSVGHGTSHHTLVVGSTGSGKSTFLHTLIMSAISLYEPEELELYLLDFKSGTEFKVYADRNIPQIQLIALDAMQEFGKSILDRLNDIMNKRSEAFNELIKEGKNIRDITDYRKQTGKKMPRILVIMDEFQILFNEENNRKVANHCGKRLADFISLARVYGMHFVLATQTMSRLSSGFAVRKSTLSEMYVRIGLKCTESECNSVFGEQKGREAFGKMSPENGTAVYADDYVQGNLTAIKVAYCSETDQEKYIEEIERHYLNLGVHYKPQVFIGKEVPNINDYQELFEKIAIENKEYIFLGQPIRIGEPVALEIGKAIRNNLLIVGSDIDMTDQLLSLYMVNVMNYGSREDIVKPKIYLADGLSIIDEDFGKNETIVVNGFRQRIRVLRDNKSILKAIDELYSIYVERKKNKRNTEKNMLYFIISNLQWIDSINLLLQNKSVNEYLQDDQEDDDEDLFGYFNDKSSATLAMMDSFLSDMKKDKANDDTHNISYPKKFMALIDSGYTYGINMVLSCPDLLSIKEYMYSFIPKFNNRIVYSLSNASADRIIPEAKTEQLPDNIVIFYDGKKPPYQMKPYSGIGEYVWKMNNQEVHKNG